MSNDGKMYAAGAVVIAALAAVLLLWSVLLWIGLAVLAIILVIVGWVIWGKVHQRHIQTRKDKAEAATLEYNAQHAKALAEQANAVAEQQRAIAIQQHAQAAALWNQTRMIPRTMVGVMLDDPGQRERVMVWPASHITYNNAAETPPTTALPAPALPGPTDLMSLLGAFRPSPTQILLALTAQGLVTCSLSGVSHVALAAPTGGGKSSLLRMLLGQMLACGVVAYLADPHFTPIDPKSGEDWRMIAARLAEPPYTDAHVIKEVVAALVAEMRRRYVLREQGKHWGTPCYLAIDEWPAILSELDKQEGVEIVTSTGKLLRQGRKVDIHLITSSQDFLVETIGGSGEIRSNLRTAYFAGGGLATARALLDQQIKLPDTPLGKGVVLLRSEEALPTPTLVRAPYASNEALYRLLPIEQDEERYWAAFPPLTARQHVKEEEAVRVCVQEPEAPKTAKVTPLLSTHTLTHKAAKVTPEQRAYILEHRGELSASAIAIMLWNDAHKNIWVRQVCQEADASQEEAE